MSIDIALEIVELAIGLVRNQSAGAVQQDATTAATLVQIVGKAVEAYRAHTGEPLDLSLIKPESLT